MNLPGSNILKEGAEIMSEDNGSSLIVDKLYENFSEVLSINESLLEMLGVNKNTLEKRYRLTLEEEQEHLPEVLNQLESSSVDHQTLTKKLFIVYHADEVGNLHLGGWKRETKWIEDEGEAALEEITDKAGQKKKILKEAVYHLETLLGEKFKYVIPALYRD